LTQDYPLLLSLFRGSWIIRRIVEVVPNLMLKSFPILDSPELNPDLVKNFERAIKKTGTLGQMRSAAKWGRLFGGAGAIMIIKGHTDLSKPLNLDEVELGAYKGLISLDRWSGIIPGPELNDDIEDPLSFGLPKYYSCMMDGAGGATIEVHSSRVLRFVGRELPKWEQQVELYWGEAEVEVVFDEMKKRDYSSWNIVSLLTRAQVIAMVEPQLASMQAGAGGSNQAYTNYITKMQAISEMLNSQGLLLLGKDGKLDTHSYSFGGVADVYHEFMKDLAAAAEIPYEILFGRESGLGSNGESGLQTFYDMIDMKRTSEVDPIIDKLMPVVAMSTFGYVPDDLDHHWSPVRTMTDKERAELSKAHADAISTYFQGDLMTKREAREEIQTSSAVTGIGGSLTDEAVAKTPDKYASELGLGEMGGEEGEGGEGAESEEGSGEELEDDHTSRREERFTESRAGSESEAREESGPAEKREPAMACGR